VNQKTETRVILIEDQEYFRLSLKSILSDIGGFKVVAEVPCEVQAIDLVKKERAELIVLDLSPGGCGYDILKAIKSSTVAKVLIFTMQADDDVVKEAFRLGADGFCAKGLTRRDFIVAIGETLNNRRPVFVSDFGGFTLSHGPGQQHL
jgi:DNA-binding NarL/FixJ family response regulator